MRLKELISAGEPLNPEVIERVRTAWGLTIRDGYGQTETTALAGNSPGQELKSGSMGRPLPGYRVALLDSDGNAQKEGEICLTMDPPPTGLMQGYQADSGGIQPFEGKVYRTGDVAVVDDEGYLTYVGRADDVFKSSDYRISPFELESALIEHPAVAEAAIVPSPDPIRLAVPKAFLVLAPGHAPDRDTALSIFSPLPHGARAVQARAAARVRQSAEDDFGKDPADRIAARGGGQPSRRQARTARILGRRLLRGGIGRAPLEKRI